MFKSLAFVLMKKIYNYTLTRWFYSVEVEMHNFDVAVKKKLSNLTFIVKFANITHECL